jgi:hypothetical protein
LAAPTVTTSLANAWLTLQWDKAESRGVREFIEVDPAELHLPPGIRSQGADPFKLARQIARHGDRLDGMPPVELVRGRDGHLRLNDGVTLATRAAKLRPGELIPAEVIAVMPNLDVTRMPKVGVALP